LRCLVVLEVVVRTGLGYWAFEPSSMTFQVIGCQKDQCEDREEEKDSFCVAAHQYISHEKKVLPTGTACSEKPKAL